MRYLIFLILFVGFCGVSQGSGLQEPGSVIRGVVTGADGKTLAGASVTVQGTNLGVIADEGGNFIIEGLKDGNYKLGFSFIGYENRTVNVELKKLAVLEVMLSQDAIKTGEVFINATRAGEHAPFTYSTIGNDLLKKQNTGYDLPFLLSLTPSLVESSEAGNGVGYTSQRIRGTDGSRINVTIDGIPLNDPESQQVFWVDLPDLAASADNIQIQRGVGTSSNGAGAFGATISIETENPGHEPSAEINSSAGSFNTFKNSVSASSGLLADKFSLSMRYSDIRSDGYIERTGSNHRSAFVTGMYITPRSRLKANIIMGEEHTGIGWWGVPKEMLGENRRYNPAGEYIDDNGVTRHYENESDNYIQNHYQLIFNHQFSGILTMNAALHYTKGKGYYEEFRQDQPYSDYGLPSLTIGDSTLTQTDLIRRKWLSNDFYGLVYSLNYKKDKLEVIAGGGLNDYLGDHFGNLIWMRNAGMVNKDHQWYFNTSAKWEMSFYGKVNYTLSDLVSIYGDLQYRQIDYKMKGIEDDLLDIGQKHRFGFFNPKAGIFLTISPKQEAYISFSVANREPSREDFKEAAGDPAATPRPETLYDVELGYQFRTGKSAFGINLYSMYYNDQLVPTGQLSNVGYPVMTNVSKSFRTGAELTAAFRPADLIEWNLNLTLSMNKIMDFREYYTNYTADTSFYLSKDLGKVDIAYSPSVIGSSDIGFRILRSLHLHLISKYVGRQYFDNTESRDRMIDPYFVNNLRLDFEPGLNKIKGLELQLLVNNILNEKYESNAYGGNWYEDGVEKSWSYYFPQAGTNFMFRMGIRF